METRIAAPSNIISALSGKLGMIPHVNVKTVYSKINEHLEMQV